MKKYLPLLLCMLIFSDGSAIAGQAGERAGDADNFRPRGGKMRDDAGPPWWKRGEGACRPEMRGRCGKRRGDWYGARKPVANAAEARGLLLNYFAGQEYTVSDLTEKRWGFKAEILDKSGAVVDRVMIDKRTGRIRSLY